MKKYLLLLPVLSFGTLFAAAPGAAPSNNYMSSLIMIVLAIVFFYFILWRPEKKRRQRQEAQRSSLAVGDKVTAMGIVGTIDKIEDTTIILKNFENNIYLKIK